MADFTASDAAEILLTLRRKLVRIFTVVVIVWALSFTFIANPLIEKIKADMLPKGANLIYTTPLEGWILKLKISLYLGIAAVLPYLIYLMYRTLKERTEILDNINITKGAAVRYGLVSTSLFSLGIAYGYLIMLPLFMKFLYQTAQSQGVLAYYTISEFINFIVLMLVVFGVVFQMPLIMVFLVGNGIVKYSTLTYYRRHIYVGFFVLGAAITPPDVLTQLMVASPMILFFEISLLATRVIHRKHVMGKG